MFPFDFAIPCLIPSTSSLLRLRQFQKEAIHTSKILLVEDEDAISEPISDFLHYDGHEVEIVKDGEEAMLRLKLSKFELLILDWSLPKVSGLQVLKELRTRGGQMPVLMLTAKSEIADRTIGLDNGADDYLTKPFDIRELRSRVRALLRRPPQTVVSTLTIGPLILDTSSRKCFLAGAEVQLLTKEFAVLEFLVRHKGTLYSADDLLKYVWRSDTESGTGAVRQCIARLRKKLEMPGIPSILTTVIGSGYRVDNI